ncbi:hypothetical protein HMPREF3039_00594 [Akkermansia sp. KLE1798]|nr:hypothetical protein HMPREF3039_00594 [Akkermansia sp. KLE1798]KZA05220.1 hypothetical protein HMPREF1326_01105 [Akkermansia sp. KLE1605]
MNKNAGKLNCALPRKTACTLIPNMEKSLRTDCLFQKFLPWVKNFLKKIVYF